MGCTGERQTIEDQMMLLKLERMEIQMEKDKKIKILSEIEGRTIKDTEIPDYIDPKFADGKNLPTGCDEGSESSSESDNDDENKESKKKEKSKKKKDKKDKKKNKNDKEKKKKGKKKKKKKKDD